MGVHKNQNNSPNSTVSEGAPQGFGLGPLLFVLYIHEYDTNISK